MAQRRFNFRTYHEESLAKIRIHFGDAVDPDWGNRLAYWNERKKNFFLRGFMYVFDIKSETTVLTHNLKMIGYEEKRTLSAMDLLDMVHDNHRLLMSFQVYKFHEALLHYTKDKIGFDYHSGGLRAIKDRKGDYWLTRYVNEPFQYDAKGRLVRYLTYYDLLSPYKGEPMYVEFFHREGKTDTKILNEMKLQTQKIKGDQLEWLLFPPQQQELIKLHAIDIDEKEIMETLQLTSKRSLEDARRRTIKSAKQCFPKNNFRNFKDVMDYIISQDLVVHNKKD